MWNAELAVRHYGCPISDTCVDHPAIRVENLSKTRLNGSHGKRLMRLHGPSEAIDNFADDFRSHDGTISFDRIPDTDAAEPAYFTSELTYQAGNPSILSLAHEAGCYQHSTVSVNSGVEDWTIHSEEKSQIRNFVERAESHDNDVEICRSVDVGPITDDQSVELATLRSELTNRQMAAYEAALELGYYDAQESTTIADIADHLNLHRSTAGEHIKKVEDKILSDVGKQIVTR